MKELPDECGMTAQPQPQSVKTLHAAWTIRYHLAHLSSEIYLLDSSESRIPSQLAIVQCPISLCEEGRPSSPER